MATAVLCLEHLSAPHNLLLGGTEGGLIHAWPLDNPKDCTLLTDHSGYPSGLGSVHCIRALHRDLFASGGGPDGMLRLWYVLFWIFSCVYFYMCVCFLFLDTPAVWALCIAYACCIEM